MHTLQNLSVGEWSDYELIDSGEHMKLERFGEVVLARPETQAIWGKRKPDAWATAAATFRFSEGKGAWSIHTAPKEWTLSYGVARILLELTNFKHVGVFPEQEPNWTWLAGEAKKRHQPKVLNLFGYTGVASVVLAHAGAKVTHVDASRQSLDWAKENMRASNLEEDAIRWILDDALQFAKREVKRGNTYDGIVLDPPAFGRGAKGEVWHIEEDLPKLMHELATLIAPKGFLLLNGYAAGYTPTSFLQLVTSHFPNAQCEYGELQLTESSSERIISSGIYVRAGVV